MKDDERHKATMLDYGCISFQLPNPSSPRTSVNFEWKMEKNANLQFLFRTCMPYALVCSANDYFFSNRKKSLASHDWISDDPTCDVIKKSFTFISLFEISYTYKRNFRIALYVRRCFIAKNKIRELKLLD